MTYSTNMSKRFRGKIGPTGFLYVVIDACHAGTSSRANDETVRGTHVGFTYNNKVFKASALFMNIRDGNYLISQVHFPPTSFAFVSTKR